MAELPKYQQTGRVFSDLPEFSFTNVKESFRRSQSMINSLDRLSTFAAKFAEEQITKDALKYAAENPLTAQQVEEASKSGVSPEELITSTGGGTLWQDTLRKLQGEQLRSDLEVRANSEALRIKSMVDRREITSYDEAKSLFESMINGNMDMLLKVNPESAIKFRDSAGSVVNSLQKVVLKKLQDDYEYDKKVETENYLPVVFDLAKDTIATEFDPEMQYAKLTNLRTTLAKVAREGGDEFGMQKLGEFDKAVAELKVNHFVELALSEKYSINPATNKPDSSFATIKMASGDFGESSALWKRLSEKEKASVMASYRTRENNLIETRKHQESLQTENDVLEVNNLLLDYDKGNKKDKSILDKLEAISRRNPKAIKAEEVKKLRDGKDDDDKIQYSDAMISLKEKIRVNPAMSWQEIQIEGNRVGLDNVTLNRYVYPFFTSESNRDYYNALRNEIIPMGGNMPTFLTKQNQKTLDGKVTDYIKGIEEKNKSLPTEKKIPVPSRKEALEIIKQENAKSPSAQTVKQVMTDVDTFIKQRKIKGVIINENSTSADTQLVNRINEKQNNKYVYDEETREFLLNALKKLDAARGK